MNDNDLISRRTLQDGISSFKMPWDYVDAINSIASISTLINEAPAVDAIPVEWLQKKRKYASEGDSLDVGIEEVLDMLGKEQEAR